MIESMELQWKADEVHGGTATRVIQARDVLWYTDGSHATLAELSSRVVPEVRFTSIGNEKWSHFRGMFFLHIPRAFL